MVDASVVWTTLTPGTKTTATTITKRRQNSGGIGRVVFRQEIHMKNFEEEKLTRGHVGGTTY